MTQIDKISNGARKKIFKFLSISFLGLILIVSFLFLFKRFVFPEQLSLIFSPKEGDVFVRWAVEIGNYRITKKDLKNKIAFEKCLNRSLEEPKAAGIFINWGFLENFKKPLKVSITKDELIEQENELRKNKSNSHMKLSNEALSCLNDLFKGNQTSFHKIVITPYLLEEKINQAFNFSKEIHKEQLEKAKDILEKIKSALENFEETAQKIAEQDEEVKYNKIQSVLINDFSPNSYPDTIIDPFNEKNPGLMAGHDISANSPFYKEVISQLQPGWIYKNVYETERNYEVIKLVSNEAGSIVYQSVIIPKKTFYNWQQEYLKKNNIKIKIYDKNFCSEIKNIYQDVWFKDLIICR